MKTTCMKRAKTFHIQKWMMVQSLLALSSLSLKKIQKPTGTRQMTIGRQASHRTRPHLLSLKACTSAITRYRKLNTQMQYWSVITRLNNTKQQIRNPWQKNRDLFLIRQNEKKPRYSCVGRFRRMTLYIGLNMASLKQFRQRSQNTTEREWRLSRRVKWQMQVSCRNQQPQSVQKQTERETKTPPEISPNQSRYLSRCRQRFCLTEQNSYIMSMGTRMMGKTRKCTQRPQITQAVYRLNLFGCRSTMPFFCLSSAVMLPWAQPPKQKQRKAKARVMVMASQLPRVERQIRKGLVQMMELMRTAPLTLSPPFRSANILKMKKHAAMSKKARRYLPKFWSYLQEGDMIQASTGLQRQVCRSQGESKREASRKTLQSRSVNALYFPSKMLSSCETLLMIQILSSSPRTARTSHLEQSIVDDSPFILLMQPVLQL